MPKQFPTVESARLYLEAQVWPTGTVCPTCSGSDRITTRKDGYYRCNACQIDFTVRTGTILSRSHVPLNKWLDAMHVIGTTPPSSYELAERIGVEQKTAWLMLKRLGEAMSGATVRLGEFEDVVSVVLAYRPSSRVNPPRERKKAQRTKVS